MPTTTTTANEQSETRRTVSLAHGPKAQTAPDTTIQEYRRIVKPTSPKRGRLSPTCFAIFRSPFPRSPRHGRWCSPVSRVSLSCCRAQENDLDRHLLARGDPPRQLGDVLVFDRHRRLLRIARQCGRGDLGADLRRRLFDPSRSLGARGRGRQLDPHRRQTLGERSPVQLERVLRNATALPSASLVAGRSNVFVPVALATTHGDGKLPRPVPRSGEGLATRPDAGIGCTVQVLNKSSQTRGYIASQFSAH